MVVRVLDDPGHGHVSRGAGLAILHSAECCTHRRSAAAAVTAERRKTGIKQARDRSMLIFWSGV